MKTKNSIPSKIEGLSEPWHQDQTNKI